MELMRHLVVAGLLVCACARVQGQQGHRRLRSGYLETNEVADTSCLANMQRVYNDHVVAPSTPHLLGEWTSTRCEVRPGPEFLLRHYIFRRHSQFELHQYYYKDSSCTEPAYSIEAHGEITVGDASWLVSGGLDAEYTLSEVSVMPYTTFVAKRLQENFHRHCPEMVTRDWRPRESYKLFEFKLDSVGNNNNNRQNGHAVDDGYYDDDDDAGFFVDRDCRSALNLVFHELQLLRVEVRKRGLMLRKELFLGDIHTDYTQRETYRPTSYQTALQFAQTASNCAVCNHIVNSQRTEPPVLSDKAPPNYGLIGEWFSERCEVRPVGQFLTRHFLFNGDKTSWEGYFHYFADERCTEPLFTVHAAGSYLIGKRSLRIRNAYKFDVKVAQMQVTPLDTRIVNLMNENVGTDACATAGSWSRGQTQDVTSTGGCAMLGLKVPVQAYELLRLEREHHRTLLYLGQGQTVSTDSSVQSASAPEVTVPERSTSFQEPMVRCGAGSETPRHAFNAVNTLEEHIELVEKVQHTNTVVGDGQSAAKITQVRTSAATPVTAGDFSLSVLCAFCCLLYFAVKN